MSGRYSKQIIKLYYEQNIQQYLSNKSLVFTFKLSLDFCLGCIFKKNISIIFKLQVSKNLNETQIEAVFAKFDSNGDGRLSMDEFKQLMEKR